MRHVRSSGELERQVRRFSKEQMHLIMQNVSDIQLTEGCNSACPDCGLGALPGVRDYIPYGFLEELFVEYGDDLEASMLYHASEPFDYHDGEHGYEDVHFMYHEATGINPTVVTSVPRGMEGKIFKYVFENNTISGINSKFINCISLTRLNKKRIFETIYGYLPELDSDRQILVPSKYALQKCSQYRDFNEDGGISEKSSSAGSFRWVLQNGEEIARILGLTDDSLLFINGFGKSSITLKERRRIEKMFPIDETNSLFHYFEKHGFDSEDEEGRDKAYERSREHTRLCKENTRKVHSLKTGIGIPRKGTGTLYALTLPDGTAITNESRPVTMEDLFAFWWSSYSLFGENEGPNTGVNIRNFLTDGQREVHTSKLGKKNVGQLAERGIGCYHGVIITPRGIFNEHTRKPTRTFPLGQKLTLIDPNDFKVADKRYVSHFRPIEEQQKKFRLLTL